MWGVEDAGEGIGEAWFGKARGRRVDVQKWDSRQRYRRVGLTEKAGRPLGLIGAVDVRPSSGAVPALRDPGGPVAAGGRSEG